MLEWYGMSPELLLICLRVLVGRCFCFCKQKTAYEMRISDWSSDVCSSDLRKLRFLHAPFYTGPRCIQTSLQRIPRDLPTRMVRMPARLVGRIFAGYQHQNIKIRMAGLPGG